MEWRWRREMGGGECELLDGMERFLAAVASD